MKDNKGGTVIASGTSHIQTDYTLESMNYLVAGVVGQI
jgi:simple sugar transport system substrate-binding protein